MKTPAEIEEAEQQIRAIQKEVDYVVREYPIEVIVAKHTTGIDTGTNEIFVPDYQRDLVWEDRRQSKFIESLLIGLPIPYLFVADVGNEDPDLEGRLEIIDGTQRIRTLVRFIANQLTLGGLERLTQLNDFTFSELTPARQRRFNRLTLRMIELTEKADEETRRDMFDRINTGSVRLNDMESRRGRSPGPFTELIKELATSPALGRLAPISDAAKRRYEHEELVARFFTFSDEYERFGAPGVGKVVSEFVDDYVDRMNERLRAEGAGGATEAELRTRWASMLQFVGRVFPNGFAKGPNGKSTPRVRFEAIGVGSALALATGEPIDEASVPIWLNSANFKAEVTSDASNNRSRVLARINFVRDKLLAR